MGAAFQESHLIVLAPLRRSRSPVIEHLVDLEISMAIMCHNGAILGSPMLILPARQRLTALLTCLADRYAVVYTSGSSRHAENRHRGAPCRPAVLGGAVTNTIDPQHCCCSDHLA